MFFHQVEQLNNSDEMKEKVPRSIKGTSYTIIPIVSPDSPAGCFLMNRDDTEDLSNMSGDEIVFFYPGEVMKDKYLQFKGFILSKIENASSFQAKEPGALIFWPQRTNLYYAQFKESNHYLNFQDELFLLVEILKTTEPMKYFLTSPFGDSLQNIPFGSPILISKLYFDVKQFFV